MSSLIFALLTLSLPQTVTIWYTYNIKMPFQKRGDTVKFIHLSDLHIGKRVYDFSMIDDQEYILSKILKIIDDEQPDCVIIAGDVYDKSIPPTEAVDLLDSFLVSLSERETQTLLISGNHDSAERISFGGRLMEQSGIHIAPVYNGDVSCVKLNDEHGAVYFYLLPFLKPAHVRRFFPDEEISSYTDALRVAVNQMNVDKSARNVLVTHQFVTGANRCESEEISVGGADNVDATVFEDFDYVALGHIHGPQSVGRKTIRYCGTPLKYSFSEINHEKSVTVVELGEKGDVSIRTVPLEPKRDWVELKGTFEKITSHDVYEGTGHDKNYFHITLIDEDDVPYAMDELRKIYSNLMKLDYDNKRTRATAEFDVDDNTIQKSPLELVEEFFEKQNGQSMGDEMGKFVKNLIEEIWEGEE